MIELVLYGTEWWCLYETSNINSFWYDTHVLIEYDGLSLNISWSSFPQMMDVTIVTTTEIVHANDMISLPNPNDLQSYYIVYRTHFFLFFPTPNDLQSYYIVYRTCPPSICTNSLHEWNVEHKNNCDGT